MKFDVEIDGVVHTSGIYRYSSWGKEMEGAYYVRGDGTIFVQIRAADSFGGSAELKEIPNARVILKP